MCRQCPGPVCTKQACAQQRCNSAWKQGCRVHGDSAEPQALEFLVALPVRRHATMARNSGSTARHNQQPRGALCFPLY